MAHREKTGTYRPLRRQAGAYAIEFAAAFMVGFLVLYAILTYGLIFMAQQSMNRAAQTAARALLAWPAAAADADTPRDAMNERANAAEVRLRANLQWLQEMAGGSQPIQTRIRLPGDNGGADSGNSPCDVSGHSPSEAPHDAAHSAQVAVCYPYAAHPLIPILGFGPWLRLPVPTLLKAEAQVDLGIAYPGTPAPN